MTPRALSIQSHVSFGHVGHGAATFALRRLGVDVHPVHTVLFSSHPGYAGWRGTTLESGAVADVLTGLFDAGVLEGCRALLTGYLGDPNNAGVVVGTLRNLRESNPDAIYVCDPVIGDAGQQYVHPDLVERFTRTLAPEADVLTPNLHELGWLAGSTISSVEAAREAAATLRAVGTHAIVATGLRFSDDDPHQRVLVDAPWGSHLITSPHVPRAFTGTGDLFTATLTAHLLQGAELSHAAHMSASSLTSILEHTHARGSRELELVAMQHALEEPMRDDVTIERLR